MNKLNSLQNMQQPSLRDLRIEKVNSFPQQQQRVADVFEVDDVPLPKSMLPQHHHSSSSNHEQSLYNEDLDYETLRQIEQERLQYEAMEDQICKERRQYLEIDENINSLNVRSANRGSAAATVTSIKKKKKADRH